MIGTSLNQYRITASVGAGGMGEVFRARDTRLNRDVAVKVLPRDFVADADRLRRFEQEAKTLAALNHPNVLTIHDAGVHDGAPYLVSELLEGRTLREEMGGGALPVRKAVDYALQIAHGLAAAHSKGVVHRDLKPENIFVTKDGRVKILDFGLAKLRAMPKPTVTSTIRLDPEAMASLTESGMILGTPAYMSPEQVRGEAADHRSDLFAFGTILCELFGVRHPFRRGTVAETMAAVLNDDPMELLEKHSAAAPGLWRIVERCLEKQPERRFQSAQDLAFAIGNAAQGIATPAAPRVSQDEGSAPAASGAQKSLAVLPFANMSDDRENEFLADGITEDLITALSRVKGLRVPARTSSFAFKGRNEDIRRIGQLLNVETVLEGSVRKSGNKLRVTAQLIKVRDGFHLWSDRHDREMKDVFDIQDDITRAIVGALEVQLGGGAETQFVRRQTTSTEAYELYVKGRIFWNQRGRAGMKKALHYFELALLEDPDCAPAWSGLADAYSILAIYDFLPYREALLKGMDAARKAVALDPHSPEAHCSMGWLLQTVDWDIAGAEREFLRAQELNPNYAPAHYWYATNLTARGRNEEGLAQYRLAVQHDPLSALAHVHLGWGLFSLRHFDEALVPLRRSLELDARQFIAHFLLGSVLWNVGQREAALTELHTAADLSVRTPIVLSVLGYVLAESGQLSAAREILEELRQRTQPAPVRSYFLALVYAGLGEVDAAFAALDRAFEEREFWLPWIGLYRVFDGLHADPRWPEFVARVEAAKRASSTPSP